MAKADNEQIVETATEARGAVKGRPVLYVLVLSLAAIVALFAIVYIVFFPAG